MTTELTVRRVAIELRAGIEQVLGKPWGMDGADLAGEAQVAKVTTPDGFVGFVAFVTWPEGQREVKMVDAVGDPGEYGRLLQAGTMAVKTTYAGDVVLLKAMKYGDRGWATLANVEWSELDLLAGCDAQQLFADHGATAGLYGDFVTTSAQYRARPGIAVLSSPTAFFIAYVVTRVIPLMIRFGKPGVEAF